MSQGPAAENGCPGGGDSCGIYARPCGPLDSGGLFVVGSLDKQMQDGKELIRLASAKGGGYFVFVWGVLT